MRRRLIPILLALNLGLLGAVMTAPPAAADDVPIEDCCKNTTEGDSFCCSLCCWFVGGCASNAECNPTQPE